MDIETAESYLAKCIEASELQLQASEAATVALRSGKNIDMDAAEPKVLDLFMKAAKLTGAVAPPEADERVDLVGLRHHLRREQIKLAQLMEIEPGESMAPASAISGMIRESFARCQYIEQMIREREADDA